MLINGITKAEPKARLRNIGVVITWTLAFVGFYIFFRYFLFEMGELPGITGSTADTIMGYMTHALGAFLLLGAIRYAYQVFFLSGDLEWLLASPLPVSRVFIAKFIENWLYGGQIIFSFGWPIALAYGGYIGAPIPYYPVALMSIGFLSIYTGSIGILICLPLMRHVTTARLRELLLAFSMGLSIWLYIIFRNLGYSSTSGPKDFSPSWLPTTYLRELIQKSAQGEWGAAMISAVIYIIPGVILAGVAYSAARRMYLSGLQRKGEQDERVKAGRGEGLLYEIARRLPPDIRAVLLKDALETIRSPRQWYYLIFATLIVGFQFFDSRELALGTGHTFLLLFFISIFSQELTVLGVAREAEAFPIVAVSGIRAWRLFAAKWLAGFIPTFIFGMVVMGAKGIYGHGGPMDVVYDIDVMAVGLIPIITYSLMVGCIFPDFKAYRTRRRISPWVLLINMAFTMVLIALVILPVSYWRTHAPGTPIWITAAALVFGITCAAIITFISFAVGSARLRRIMNNIPGGIG